MVVPEAHFPVVYYKVVDDVGLLLVGMHVKRLYAVLHQQRRPFLCL